jgi:hypothetical protein
MPKHRGPRRVGLELDADETFIMSTSAASSRLGMGRVISEASRQVRQGVLPVVR